MLSYLICLEPVESARTAHQDGFSILCGAYGSVAELVALQSAFGIELGDCSALESQFVESLDGSYPYIALVVLGNACHAVVGEPVGCGIMFRLYSFSEVEAEGSILGAIPYLVFAVNKHAVGESVLVETVDALKGGSPAVLLAVEACQSH